MSVSQDNPIRIQVENLGVLRHAEFELADLTLICGDNNSGKTYATYALYGFLSTWREVLSVDIPTSEIATLMKNGVVRLDLGSYGKKLRNSLSKGDHTYTQILPRRVFSSSPDRFKETAFRVYVDDNAFSVAGARRFRLRFGSEENTVLTLTKDEDDPSLVATLLTREKDVPPADTLKYIMSFAIVDLLLDGQFPRPFVASAERTGVAMFRSELVSARGKQRPFDDGPYQQQELFYNERLDYPLPVEVNIDFLRRIERTTKEDSFLTKHHRDVLSEFSDIIGGEYAITESTIQFIPTLGVPLTMDESSSAVRSLLIIGLYLRHVARPGDLLMVDEPELNLHPRNQRRIARLFSRLVNLGVRVFATTHSDYIVKELNTLIMLQQDTPRLKRLAMKEEYRPEELLDPRRVRVYVADSIKQDEVQSQYHTLLPAVIDPEMGIEARSFDDTIDEMNEIQDAIVWGDEG